jgi:hypothetical protein
MATSTPIVVRWASPWSAAGAATAGFIAMNSTLPNKNHAWMMQTAATQLLIFNSLPSAIAEHDNASSRRVFHITVDNSVESRS